MIDVMHEACPCCGGGMHYIGELRTEQLDVAPAQLRVRVTRRPRYACRRLAVHAGHRLGDYRLIGIAAQRATTAPATQDALTRAAASRSLRLVGLLSLRRRQA